MVCECSCDLPPPPHGCSPLCPTRRSNRSTPHPALAPDASGLDIKSGKLDRHQGMRDRAPHEFGWSDPRAARILSDAESGSILASLARDGPAVLFSSGPRGSLTRPDCFRSLLHFIAFLLPDAVTSCRRTVCAQFAMVSFPTYLHSGIIRGDVPIVGLMLHTRTTGVREVKRGIGNGYCGR